jgi:hypothetical protein
MGLHRLLSDVWTACIDAPCRVRALRSDSIWPHSRAVSARDLAGVAEHEVRRIVTDNWAVLHGYGIGQ